jgi:hypothetical protein
VLESDERDWAKIIRSAARGSAEAAELLKGAESLPDLLPLPKPPRPRERRILNSRARRRRRLGLWAWNMACDVVDSVNWLWGGGVGTTTGRSWSSRTPVQDRAAKFILCDTTSLLERCSASALNAEGATAWKLFDDYEPEGPSGMVKPELRESLRADSVSIPAPDGDPPVRLLHVLPPILAAFYSSYEQVCEKAPLLEPIPDGHSMGGDYGEYVKLISLLLDSKMVIGRGTPAKVQNSVFFLKKVG